jgi:ribosomal protein S18 acetylase RimI-like enzyme
MTNIRRADKADADAITDILSDSFQADPPLAWILPDPDERRRLSPAFFRPFVDLVLETGQAYVTEDLSGAALWMYVDVHATDADDPADLRRLLIDGIGPDKAERFFVLDELFSAQHPVDESHEYLLFIGTDPARQNQGVGTALLAHRLAELDQAKSPAYLEASSEHNVRLYERMGFAKVGETVVLPDGPALHPMWRPA